MLIVIRHTGFGGGGPNSGDYQIMMYDKPWYHAPAYLVGTLLAMFYMKFRDPETKAAPKIQGVLLYVCWVAALLVIFYSSAGQYWATSSSTVPCTPGPDDYECQDGQEQKTVCNWSRGWDIFYSTTFRFWWCVAVAFMCWASLAEQGGPIGFFLGMQFWTPFAKLTFGVYMMHVMMIRLHYNTTEGEHGFHYTDYTGKSCARGNQANQSPFKSMYSSSLLSTLYSPNLSCHQFHFWLCGPC